MVSFTKLIKVKKSYLWLRKRWVNISKQVRKQIYILYEKRLLPKTSLKKRDINKLLFQSKFFSGNLVYRRP